MEELLRREVIRKTILLKMEDGSMYSFDFDIIVRLSYEGCVLNKYNDKPFYHLKFDKFNKEGKDGYVIVEPDKHIEIKFMGGLSRDLIRNASKEWSSVFIKTVGEEYDNYISYPYVYENASKLNYIEQVHNVISNWSINFIYYFLSKSDYDFKKASRYLRFWYKEDALKRFKSKLGIKNIEFKFR